MMLHLTVYRVCKAIRKPLEVSNISGNINCTVPHAALQLSLYMMQPANSEGNTTKLNYNLLLRPVN